MPDKKYIQKVYDFMNTAYGEKGAVTKGVFRGSFNDFYDRINTDSKYADKIYGALSKAYGPMGSLKRDAFSSDITGFRERVLAPSGTQPTTRDIPTGLPEENPVQAVLQTGKDLSIPEQQRPGYFQDIKAFEPDIQATELVKQAQSEQASRNAEKYLLQDQSVVPINMAGQLNGEQTRTLIDKNLNDPNVQYRNNIKQVLEKVDEEDKNRLANQQVADEMYKTPQGKFYYDFVRPVYKEALNVGKNTAAFGARAVGADKVADKIIDYFDFDRLAREGNPTAALNMEPSKQQGKLGMNNILPRTMEGLTNMAALMGGSSLLGGGNAALMATSFVSQYEDYRKTAKQNGLSDADADKFATVSAGLNSALELVSPNKVITKELPQALTKKEIFNYIKNGASAKDAIKKFIVRSGDEVLKENMQEFAQNMGDKTAKYAFDKYVLDDPRFGEETILPSLQESLETAVITTLVTGLMSSPHLVARNKPSSLERSAWAAAAQNPGIIEGGLKNAVAQGQLTEAKADQIKQNVGEYTEIYDALSAKGYNPEMVERVAMNAFRAKKLDEHNKPLSGIEILTPITAQDDATKIDLEKGVLSAIAGESETDYDTEPESKKVTVQQPEEVSHPQVIAVGQKITEPSQPEQNAIQEQTARKSVLREERPELGLQEVGEGNAESQIPPTESETEQPKVQEEVKVKSGTKESRDQAVANLKNKFDPYKHVGIISDPKQNLKRDKEFYSALANYIKEEILYRANQVKGFANEKKAKIKRMITSSLKEEGMTIQDLSMLNDAFDDAFSQIKKIPGVLPEQPNDRISFKDYVRDRIKVREAGFKEGSKGPTGRIKAVRAVIGDMLKGKQINLNITQLRSITSLLQKAVGTKDKIENTERTVKTITNILWQARNKQKISRTKGLMRSLGKLKRSKSMVAQDIDWIKGLQLPSPSKVDDLDSYMDMLKDFIDSRKGNELNQKYTKEEISEFVDQENDRIYTERKESMQDDLDDLKEEGIIPKDVTLDEYMGMLSNEKPPKLSEGISKKEEILKQELKKKLGYLKNRLPEFYGYERDLATQLADVDPSYLKGPDLIKLNNVLNNIAEFGSLDSAGDIVTSYEAQKANESLIAGGEKIRELAHEDVISKKNLSNIMAGLFYNDNAVAAFRSKTIGPIERKLSPVFRKTQNVVKAFVNLNKKHKIGAAANARLHAYAYLNQYKGIESGEVSDNLSQRLDDLVDDAKYFIEEANRIRPAVRKKYLENATDRLDALKDFGLIDYGISKSQVEDEGKTIRGKPRKKTKFDLWVKVNDNFDSQDPTKSLETAWDKMSAGEKEVYDFARNAYDELTDKVEFVTRAYAGKDFQRERNYISLVARKKTGENFADTELSDQTDLTYDLRSINSKPAGMTMRRVAKKPENIYYDGDFFSNFVNRYYQSLYTAEVLPGLQVVAKTVINPDFKRYITGQLDIGFNKEKGAPNYDKFKNKLIQAVNQGKYAPFFKPNPKSALDNAATQLMSAGVKMALHNIWQGPAQLAPALLHTVAISNAKATALALGTGFRALVDGQYAKNRAKFLENFTAVKRSALGSDAFNSYVKRLGDEPGWWTDTKGYANKMQKISAFSLEKGDQAAQNTALISGYITSLLRQGKIKAVSEFDFAKEAKNPNNEALAFAEQTASAVNNESAREYKPDVLKDSEKAKYLWMLQGFSLNAYQNAMNKAKIMFDNRRTTQERNEARLHFAGYLGEMAAYQFVKHASRGFQLALAGALVSALFGIKHEEDEEEKRKRKEKEAIRTATNILADITLSNTNALVQGGAKNLINQGYKEWAKAKVREKKKAAKEMGKKFDPRGTYLSPYFAPYYGVEGAGGGVEFYTSAGEKAVKLMSSVMGWSDDPDAQKKKSEEKKRIEDISKKTNVTLNAAAMLLRSSDLIILNNRIQQQLQAAGKKKAPTGAATTRGASRSRRAKRRNTNKR